MIRVPNLSHEQAQFHTSTLRQFNELGNKINRRSTLSKRLKLQKKKNFLELKNSINETKSASESTGNSKQYGREWTKPSVLTAPPSTRRLEFILHSMKTYHIERILFTHHFVTRTCWEQRPCFIIFNTFITSSAVLCKQPELGYCLPHNFSTDKLVSI